MKPRFAASILGMFFAMAFFAPAAFASTGFVNTPLWVSPANPKENDKVTLSALFHNEEPDTISGTILFHDGNILLSEKSITLRPDEVGTVSTTFVVSAGSHVFSASTKDMAQVSTTGSLEVLTVPQATVKLPLQFVPKTIVPLGAKAADATTDDAGTPSVVLEKVDKAQSAILDALPPNVKETVTATTSAVDDWRAVQAKSFSQSKAEAEKTLNAEKTAKSAKPGAKKVPSDAGPFTYLKYFVYSGLSFLFGSPVVFYLAGVLILYLIFRFIFSRARGKKKNKLPKVAKAKS